MTNKINIEELAWQELSHDNFSVSRKQLGMNSGGQMIGTSLYKLLPGKKAFPYHCHHANEEAIFVLEGSGTLRLHDTEIEINEGDYVAMLRGSEHAHQIINTSNESLRYLCISTMIEPEVVEYPDSNKIGIMASSPPGGKKNQKSYKGFYRKESTVSYYDDES